jgi:4-oxalocrotonate tautomerase
MPYANLKVPAGTLTAEQKQHAVDVVTDLYADLYGERARPNVLVLVDEVKEAVGTLADRLGMDVLRSRSLAA